MSPNTCMMSPALKVSSACQKTTRTSMSTTYSCTLSQKKKTRLWKSDLYVCVGRALTRIVIKDGDHPASSWGWVPHSCGSWICQSNRGQSDILMMSGAQSAHQHAAHPFWTSDPLSVMLNWGEVALLRSNGGKVKFKQQEIWFLFPWRKHEHQCKHLPWDDDWTELSVTC